MGRKRKVRKEKRQGDWLVFTVLSLAAIGFVSWLVWPDKMERLWTGAGGYMEGRQAGEKGSVKERVPPREKVPVIGRAAAAKSWDEGRADVGRRPEREQAEPAEMVVAEPEWRDRVPADPFEIQLALARRGISPGPFDGVLGEQTRLALSAWQKREGLLMSGEWDEASRSRLRLEAPPHRSYRVSGADLERLAPVGQGWMAKSQQDKLEYETILELIAEQAHSFEGFIRSMNPDVDWDAVQVGQRVVIPAIEYPVVTEPVVFVRIYLQEKILHVCGAGGKLLAHFPVSIAARVEKRPVGVLRVETTVADPNYRFDPDIFRESAEARAIGRPLMIPPGPNNPVGSAWIGLDRRGYGIHGTPRPELVGRTESHGCFRLANWDAEYLAQLVRVGTPVYVERSGL